MLFGLDLEKQSWYGSSSLVITVGDQGYRTCWDRIGLGEALARCWVFVKGTVRVGCECGTEERPYGCQYVAWLGAGVSLAVEERARAEDRWLECMVFPAYSHLK